MRDEDDEDAQNDRPGDPSSHSLKSTSGVQEDIYEAQSNKAEQETEASQVWSSLQGDATPKEEQAKSTWLTVLAAIAWVGVGVFMGVAFWGANAPEAEVAQARISELEQALAASQAKVVSLERSLAYRANHNSKQGGALLPRDRKRHLVQGKRYAKLLKRAQAQPAADLMLWFVDRWNALLDDRQSGDRLSRRAKALSQLMSGMAQNIDPEDFVPWQAEFLESRWLGDVHFDLDGDGLPTSRFGPNPKDGFASRSICEIAMALNQSVTDAQVLLMPNLKCDAQNARLSLFLSGETLDDALSEFVRGARRVGFSVVEKRKKGTRLILVGKR